MNGMILEYEDEFGVASEYKNRIRGCDAKKMLKYNTI